jgi:hypothetical protein
MIRADMRAPRNTLKLTCYLLICLTLLGVSAAQAAPPERVEITFEIHFGSMKLGIGEDRRGLVHRYHPPRE